MTSLEEEGAITLIVPVLNGLPRLDALLGSIDHQTRPFDRVVLVDNGSTDGTVERLLEYTDSRPDAVLLHEPRRGPGPARQRGLEAAVGSWIALTDADCELDVDWCRQALMAFQDDPSLDVIGGVERIEASDLSPSFQESPTQGILATYARYVQHLRLDAAQPQAITHKAEWFDRRLVTTMNMVARREVLEHLPFEDWRAGEDIDWWMRALDQGHNILCHHPGLVVVHATRDSVRSFLEQQWRYAGSVPKIVKRHFRGSFTVATTSKKITSFPGPSGLVELTPNVVLLAWLPFTPWALAAYAAYFLTKPWVLRRISRQGPSPLRLSQTIALTAILFLFRATVTAASLLSSIRHRVIVLR